MSIVENLPESSCPRCGYPFDAATNLCGPRGPQEGDLSVCIACGTILVYEADLSSHVATEEDLAHYPPERLATALRAQELIRREIAPKIRARKETA